MASFFTKKSLKSNDTERSSFRTWLSRFFMSLGILFFISICLSVISFIALLKDNPDAKPLPPEFIIVHEFKGTMPEMPLPPSLLDSFKPRDLSLYHLMVAMDKARDDDRVKAFAVRLIEGEYSLTQIESLRKAIIDFRASGKKAYLYSNAIGGFSNGMGEYWLASAFDEIHIQPVGTFSINGIYIEQPYLKDALSNIGVEMEMEQRKAYKTGPETYLRNRMSPQSRETLNNIASSIMDRITNDIAAAREISRQEIEAAMNASPLLLDEAERLNFIDAISHIDEFEDIIKSGDKDLNFVSLSRYSNSLQHKRHSSKENKGLSAISYILVEGMILDEDPMASIQNTPKAFILPSDIITAKDVSTAIYDATENDAIKVIILRINSPGGSPSASETIRRAVVEARKKGKYVIAAMGDTAASGGYWIAVNADIIIASDLTITGSIGVYGGKPNISGLWDKLDINWDQVSIGDHAGMWSLNKPFSASERKRFSIMMDHVYDAFIKRVEEGRKLDIDAVEKIAQGRVWMGEDARLNGLVDETGDFATILQIATEKAGGQDWRDEKIMVPYESDPLQELMDLLDLPIGIKGIELPYIVIQAVTPSAIVIAPELQIYY